MIVTLNLFSLGKRRFRHLSVEFIFFSWWQRNFGLYNFFRKRHWYWLLNHQSIKTAQTYQRCFCFFSSLQPLQRVSLGWRLLRLTVTFFFSSELIRTNIGVDRGYCKVTVRWFCTTWHKAANKSRVLSRHISLSLAVKVMFNFEKVSSVGREEIWIFLVNVANYYMQKYLGEWMTFFENVLWFIRCSSLLKWGAPFSFSSSLPPQKNALLRNWTL